MTERPILIVMRLADMIRVHPDQTTGLCERCSEPVGIYPSGQAAIKRFPDIEIVCQVCHHPGPGARLAPGALSEPFQSRKK